MRSGRPREPRARSTAAVFPDQGPTGVAHPVQYMSPDYEGPVLDRPVDMVETPQTLRYGQRMPSIEDLAAQAELENEDSFESLSALEAADALQTRGRRAAGDQRARAQEDSARFEDEGALEEERARAEPLSSSGSSERASAARFGLRKGGAGRVAGVRAHTRSQSAGTGLTTAEGFQRFGGLKKSVSDRGGAPVPTHPLMEQDRETGRKRQHLETVTSHEAFGGFGSAVGFPRGLETPRMAIGRLEGGGSGNRSGQRRLRGAEPAYRFEDLPTITDRALFDGIPVSSPVERPEERSRRAARPVREREPLSEEEAELGLATALELGRHLAKGDTKSAQPRQGGEETGETARVGTREDVTPVSEFPSRRRRSGKAWWQAAAAANLQALRDDKE